VTFDLDATETKVFGRGKRGTGRSRHGHLAYNSYVVTWAERGRALTSELKGGNQARIKASESGRMLGRAQPLLPAEHGQITVRGDSGFYSLELMIDCRKRKMRFTFSATRTTAMWSRLAEVDQDAWADALDMPGAQVAELPFTPEGWKHEPLRLIVRRVPITAEEIQATSPRARRRKTIPPEQLQMVLDGELSSTYGYSFIVTDIPASEKTAAEVEYFHRHRAQIEERFKDAKLGQALRHLPSGKLTANRLWLCCCLLALNLSAFICDLSPAAAASGQASRRAHPAAPARQNAQADPVLRARPDRPHRPPDHRAPPRRLPALRAAQRHLPRRARAPRTLEPGHAPPQAQPRRAAQLADPATARRRPRCARSAAVTVTPHPCLTVHTPRTSPIRPTPMSHHHYARLLTELGQMSGEDLRARPSAPRARPAITNEHPPIRVCQASRGDRPCCARSRQPARRATPQVEWLAFQCRSGARSGSFVSGHMCRRWALVPMRGLAQRIASALRQQSEVLRRLHRRLPEQPLRSLLPSLMACLPDARCPAGFRN
jgi:hypothetical protein